MFRKLIPLTLVLTGCASSAWPEKGPVAPHQDPVGRKVVDKDQLAALLNDNPTSLARRAKDGTADSAMAAKGGGPNGPGAVGEGPELDAGPIMKKAVAALEEKNFPEADKLAREVIAIDPKGYPYAYVILGDVALESKDYAAALENYKKAMELDPKDGWAAQRAATALQKQKKPLEARALLRKFTEQNADTDADTWDALAWMEMELGDMKKAEHAFNEAIRVSEGKDAEAWYGLALIYAQRQDAKGTEKALAALFALQPERRLVIERDPTFFRMRIHPNVAALFSPKMLAESKLAAEKKKKGEVVATNSGTKLTVPGGAEKSFLDQIRFDFDSAKIRTESNPLLDEVATFLKAQKGLEFVEITGHADRRGDEKYNITLSEKRASAVRDALVLRGVPVAILKIRGYGVYCPLDDGEGEAAFAKNRRVQFAIGASGKVLGDELTCQERMRKWLKPNTHSAKLTIK